MARAIVKKAEETASGRLDSEDFRAISGYGATAVIGGETFYVGKQALFLRVGLESYSIPQIEKLKMEGKTLILVGNKRKIFGVIGIRDDIRPQAKGVVEKLHRMGIRTAMLSGDNKATADAIAGQLQIDDVRADLKPEDKIRALEELSSKYGPVAMVGDGINDAPGSGQRVGRHAMSVRLNVGASKPYIAPTARTEQGSSMPSISAGRQERSVDRISSFPYPSLLFEFPPLLGSNTCWNQCYITMNCSQHIIS